MSVQEAVKAKPVLSCDKPPWWKTSTTVKCFCFFLSLRTLISGKLYSDDTVFFRQKFRITPWTVSSTGSCKRRGKALLCKHPSINFYCPWSKTNPSGCLDFPFRVLVVSCFDYLFARNSGSQLFSCDHCVNNTFWLIQTLNCFYWDIEKSHLGKYSFVWLQLRSFLIIYVITAFSHWGNVV